MGNLKEKILSGQRIDENEGLDILKNFSTLEIGQFANLLKSKKGLNKEVSFVVDTNPNYTNICDTECSFCAFWRTKDSNDAYTLPVEKVIEIVRTSYHNLSLIHI